MLTIGQVKTAGFFVYGEVLCPECAAERVGALRCARLDAQFMDGGGDGASRASVYELGEYESEEAYRYGETLREDGEYTEEEIDEAVENFHLPCEGTCGRFWVDGDTWALKPEEAKHEPDSNDGVWLW